MERRLIPEQLPWNEMRDRFKWNVPKYFNIANAICDDWAKHAPDKIALQHLETDGSLQDWTYADLERASNRFAVALAYRGIGQGDRVAILLAQHPAVLITHIAVMKLGGITLPIFSAFGGDALAYRLADSGAKAIVSEAKQIDKVMGVRSIAPDLREIYTIDGGDARDFWDEIENAHGHFDPIKTRADDPAMMIYTSGTTGPPKGVLHAHRFLLGHLPSIETSHEGFPLPGDRGWTPADWAWIGGLMDMAMPCLYFGVPLLSHRMERFDPEAAFELIDRFNLKNLFMPPTALKLMRASGLRGKTKLRSISSGGESLSPELIAWGADTFGAPINEIYGQTECNLICTHTGTTMERRSGSMGQPVPGFDVRLLDPIGDEVGVGELGEIAVCGPNPVMFLEYWGRPDDTATKFSGDWLKTGDLGVRDGDGYITFHGREDDVISSAGYRIGPSEIENCLTDHPNVVMAAAIGAPDAVRGQVIHAFVTLKGPADAGLEQDLIERVRTRISPHVAPKKIHVVDEMPLTTTGKILRRELRRLNE